MEKITTYPALQDTNKTDVHSLGWRIQEVSASQLISQTEIPLENLPDSGPGSETNTSPIFIDVTTIVVVGLLLTFCFEITQKSE